MSGALIFGLAVAAFVMSAVFIVGIAAIVVFNVLGFFWSGTFFLLVTCIFCGSIAWAWRDAGQRGKPGWAAALLVGLGFWPFGLLMWILFRPEKTLPLAAPAMEVSPPPSPPVISETHG